MSSFGGESVEGFLDGGNHCSKVTKVGKPLTVWGTPKWVSTEWGRPGGKNHVAKVLECYSEEVGLHSVGDGEAMVAPNWSSILGRLSWQQLKSAI